jgi:ribonucleoside-diphosphate reductase alpha chain
MLAGCSSGIEPIYSREFQKVVLGGDVVIDYSPIYKDVEVDTALEVPYPQHIYIQQAFQLNVDNSISKTINMPADATVEEVEAAYDIAWQCGLKGITIFRDTCKEGVLQGLSECEGGRCEL